MNTPTDKSGGILPKIIETSLFMHPLLGCRRGIRMTNCPRCGKPQTPQGYCVKWKDNECIRMESVEVLKEGGKQ